MEDQRQDVSIPTAKLIRAVRSGSIPLTHRLLNSVQPLESEDLASACASRLGSLGATARLRLYRRGQMSRYERLVWVRNFSEEIPEVNGELEWIARDLADLDVE